MAHPFCAQSCMILALRAHHLSTTKGLPRPKHAHQKTSKNDVCLADIDNYHCCTTFSLLQHGCSWMHQLPLKKEAQAFQKLRGHPLEYGMPEQALADLIFQQPMQKLLKFLPFLREFLQQTEETSEAGWGKKVGTHVPFFKQESP